MIAIKYNLSQINTLGRRSKPSRVRVQTWRMWQEWVAIYTNEQPNSWCQWNSNYAIVNGHSRFWKPAVTASYLQDQGYAGTGGVWDQGREKLEWGSIWAERGQERGKMGEGGVIIAAQTWAEILSLFPYSLPYSIALSSYFCIMFCAQIIMI